MKRLILILVIVLFIGTYHAHAVDKSVSYLVNDFDVAHIHQYDTDDWCLYLISDVFVDEYFLQSEAGKYYSDHVCIKIDNINYYSKYSVGNEFIEIILNQHMVSEIAHAKNVKLYIPDADWRLPVKMSMVFNETFKTKIINMLKENLK